MTSARRTREWIVAGTILAIIGAVSLGIVVVNRRTAADLQHQFYVPHATKLTPDDVLLQQYIRINTTNPPGNETLGARFLAARLREGGVASELIESAPGRGNLYARIRGRAPGAALLLLNHIDVVPAAGRWTRPPFSGSVALNMIYGRGAIDMKGVAICQLEAMLAVAHAGRTPDHDLIFLAVADEEQGGSMGTQWLLAHRPDIFEGVRYVLNEGGISEMQRESLTYFGVETGAKQTTTVDLAAGSREALQRARTLLEPDFDPRDPDRVLAGVRHYFAAVAPTRVETKETLTDIDETIRIGKFWLVPDIYRHLLANTVRAFGVEREGAGYKMRVYLFNLPDEDPDARLASLGQKVAPLGVTIGKVVQKQGPAPISNDVTPLFDVIRRRVREEYGPAPVGPVVLAFSTNDSRFLRAHGITCYGLQPFLIDFFQSLSVHGVDERIRVDWFDSGLRLMKNVVSDYAFGGIDKN